MKKRFGLGNIRGAPFSALESVAGTVADNVRVTSRASVVFDNKQAQIAG